MRLFKTAEPTLGSGFPVSKSSVNILLIVNESPWQSSLAMAAFRFAGAASRASGNKITVYFRGDGVYNAVAGGQADPGTPDLAQSWQQMADDSGLDLILCSADSSRRVPTQWKEGLSPGFRQSGLAEVMELIGSADRVVTF